MILLLLLLGRHDAQVSAVLGRLGMKHTCGEIYIHLTQTAPKVQALGRLLIWGEMALAQTENACHFGNAPIYRVFDNVLFCDTEGRYTQRGGFSETKNGRRERLPVLSPLLGDKERISHVARCFVAQWS